MTDATTIQTVLALLTVAGAGISVYVGLKMANTENRKDIEHLRTIIQKLDATVTDHVNPNNHVSRDQIAALNLALADLRHNDDVSHTRIEQKIDRIEQALMRRIGKE